MVQAAVAERGLIVPFNVDSQLHYKLEKVNVGLIRPEDKPFHLYIAGLLAEEFMANGEGFTEIRDHKRVEFPTDARIGIRIDDDLAKERRPTHLYGRHVRPVADKKGVYVLTTPTLPSDISLDDNSLSDWMRALMTKKAAQNALVITGDISDEELRPGAIAIYSSMEGNTSVVPFEGDPREFAHKIAQKMRIQGAAHMVKHKEGIKVDFPTFESWIDRPEVQGIAYASSLLAQHNKFRDLNLRDYASRLQVELIYHELGTAGATEGNIGAVVRGFAGRPGVMAVTESGVNKTKVSPAQGQVVAVPDLSENGTSYLIMKGLPEGHPITIFRHPSRRNASLAVQEFVSAFRRGELKKWFKDIPKPTHEVDHPSSVETTEIAHSFRFIQLLAQGKVDSLEGYLEYMVKEFENNRTIPVVVNGDTADMADAAIHFHETAKHEQEDPTILVEKLKDAQSDMEFFGFEHSPPCGSAESAIFLLKQIERMYKTHGIPTDKNVIWMVHLPGHGVFAFGFNGVKNLADKLVTAKYEPYIVRYPDTRGLKRRSGAFTAATA